MKQGRFPKMRRGARDRSPGFSLLEAASSRGGKLVARTKHHRNMLSAKACAPHECSCELLILPDGGIITHNLTPAVAALLKETLGV